MAYEDHLGRLKLPTLSYRRLNGDMIVTYRIISGVTMSLFNLRIDSKTSSQKYKIFKKRPRLEVKNPRNSLSKHAMETPTVETFEGRLERKT